MKETKQDVMKTLSVFHTSIKAVKLNSDNLELALRITTETDLTHKPDTKIRYIVITAREVSKKIENYALGDLSIHSNHFTTWSQKLFNYMIGLKG